MTNLEERHIPDGELTDEGEIPAIVQQCRKEWL